WSAAARRLESRRANHDVGFGSSLCLGSVADRGGPLMAETHLPSSAARLEGGSFPGAAPGPASHQGFAATDRRDGWWAVPVVQAIGLSVLGAYATWAAFQGTHFSYSAEGRTYLSPFYSPLLAFRWWPLSPALLVLWAPLGFRATCYYYRKAYY